LQSAEDLVTQLRDSSFTKSRDEQDYMEQFAKRAKILYNVNIITATPKKWLRDCIKNELIKVVITH